MSHHDRRQGRRAGRVRRREDRDVRLARRRANRLRAFADGVETVPILVHDDPDPDAVAAAFGVRVLLGRSPEAAPIVTLGAPTRPENRRLIELLHLRVTVVHASELYSFERLVSVDTAPRGLEPARLPCLAIIDHHPPEGGYPAEFVDVRPDYAAASTIVAEYLLALDPERIGRALATALLYGIKTDSDNLTRSVTPADVRAYAFLVARADLALLRRVERPMYPVHLIREFGRALTGIAVENGVAAVHVGPVDETSAHIMAELADFCLSVEGVSWVVVAAELGDDVVLTIRHLGGGPGAGELAERLTREAGHGGGHAAMARASWPREAAARMLHGPAEQATKALLQRVREGIESLRST
ncbi:MAG TPA: DHH family phosphoesterase [Longimicrobiales bacterium]|nr:DHH family phosphoesterase [Longimicrobiales bacterium]